MTQKFGRSYRLTIDPADGGQPILIQLPFTVEFWMQRNTLANLNTLSIDVYNLSESTRRRVFQDRFDWSPNRTVTFEVGYSTLYRIFFGQIFEASSAREGTNIVTRIECRSGQYDVAATQTFQTVQSGQTLGDVYKLLIGQFPTLKLGAIGDFKDKLLRPLVLNGNTYDLLKAHSNSQVFIDNGKVYVLKDSEVLKGEVPVLNDATGLLETPRRDDGFLVVNTLLEAGINIGEQAQLESSVQPVFNGQYKVLGIQHRGMISAAVCGRATSTFNLLANNKFDKFTQVAPA